MMNKLKSLLLVTIFSCILQPALFAQENTQPTETQPTQNQAPDPIDEVVNHINNLNQIIINELDNPETLISKINAYLEENKKNMRKASAEFEKKMAKLSVDEAERYRDTIQRKLDKPLEKFLTNMLSFSRRHPESAKKLDEILKDKI